MKKEFEPIVPLMGYPINTLFADEISRMHREFGIRRFVLCGPVYGSVSIHGLPTEEEFMAFAQELLSLNRQFNKDGIEVGWWCVCTMDNGAEHLQYQHVVNHDGTVSPNALCPLDEKWRKEFLSRMRIVADVAHPRLILIEDDFELSNQVGVNFGCFCPLHLRALSRRLGRDISREELGEYYRRNDDDSLGIRQQFTQIVKESIFLLAREMREMVDSVDSTIRLGMCEPIASDRDGYLSLEEPRILAGENTRPLIRVEGSVYSCRNAGSTLPEALSHAMYTFERLPSDYEIIHETDTYPHSRYFMSAHYFNALLYGAVACGAQGSLLYATQYLDDALEDDGYLRIYSKNARRIAALSNALTQSQIHGLHIVYTPELKQRTLPDESLEQVLPSMASLIGRFGIPYSTKNGNIVFLIGAVAACLPDKQILEYLSKGVILDAQAAENLFKRGFGKYLGVKISPMKTYRFCQERLCDIHDLEHIRGRRMYNYATYPAGSEKDHAPYVEITSEGAEEMSYFADYNGDRTNSACVRFENSLGGRVGIFAAGFVGNGTSNLFCFRKKELFLALLEWINRAPMDIVAVNRANIWVLERCSESRTFFMITDLNGDDDRELVVKLAPSFRGRQFSELQQDGTWKNINFQWIDECHACIPNTFKRLEMRIFSV